MDIQNEIEFWTRILRDHAEFQYTSLSPIETEAINKAGYFMKLFEEINADARSDTNKSKNICNCKTAVIQFIKFKRVMLTKLMTCSIKLRMPPSFLNHMINEALEFLHVLDLADGTENYNTVLENIRIHKIWLPDASGHASTVAADLDPMETDLIKNAEEFVKRFDNLFKKAYEMYKMYERTGLENGALQYFNQEVIICLSEFIRFLDKVEVLKTECRIFSSGTFSPLIPNHMIREEMYYVNKIKQLSKMH